MPISFYTYARRNKIKGVQSKHIHNVADFHARLLMLSPQAKIDMFRLYRDLLMDNKINRDTRTEQRLFKRTPDERKKAIYRARNRREFEAAGLVKPGDKLHIHHLDIGDLNIDDLGVDHVDVELTFNRHSIDIELKPN